MRWGRNTLGLLLSAALALALVACGRADGERAAVTTGAGAAGAAAPEPAFHLGVVANTIGWGPRVGHQQDLVEQLGVRWLREEIFWSRVVPRRGARDWSAYDRLFVAAAHRGMHVLPLLNDAPAWAGGRDGALPTDTAGYAGFVRDAVDRYGPHGTFWKQHPTLDRRYAPVWFELWNEPYFARPAQSALTARRYARLADAGLAAGHAADADARFLISTETRSDGDPNLDARWLGRVLAARPGLLAHADGIAAHPYAGDANGSLEALRSLHVTLQARGAELPIWVTEVGWSTCGGTSGCVTEGEQAADLSRFLKVTVQDKLADAAFVYHLLSWTVPPGDNGGGFGLLRRDGTRKPAWAVVHRTATSLAASAGAR